MSDTPSRPKRQRKSSSRTVEEEEEVPETKKAKRGSNKGRASGGSVGTTLYCLCKQPYTKKQPMVGCDMCDDWFHYKCVGLKEVEVGEIESYVCPRCKKAQAQELSGGEGDAPMNESGGEEETKKAKKPRKPRQPKTPKEGGEGGEKPARKRKSKKEEGDVEGGADGAPKPPRKRKSAKQQQQQQQHAEMDEAMAAEEALRQQQEHARQQQAMAQGQPVPPDFSEEEKQAARLRGITALLITPPAVPGQDSGVSLVSIAPDNPDMWHQVVTGSPVDKAQLRGLLPHFAVRFQETLAFLGAGERTNGAERYAFNPIATQIHFTGMGAPKDRHPGVYGNALVIKCDNNKPFGVSDMTADIFHSKIVPLVRHPEVLQYLDMVMKHWETEFANLHAQAHGQVVGVPAHAQADGSVAVPAAAEEPVTTVPVEAHPAPAESVPQQQHQQQEQVVAAAPAAEAEAVPAEAATVTSAVDPAAAAAAAVAAAPEGQAQ